MVEMADNLELVLIVWLAGICATVVHQLATEITVTEANKHHSVIHYYKGLPDQKHKKAFALAVFFGVALWFISFTYLLFVLIKKSNESPSD